MAILFSFGTDLLYIYYLTIHEYGQELDNRLLHYFLLIPFVLVYQNTHFLQCNESSADCADPQEYLLRPMWADSFLLQALTLLQDVLYIFRYRQQNMPESLASELEQLIAILKNPVNNHQQ